MTIGPTRYIFSVRTPLPADALFSLFYNRVLRLALYSFSSRRKIPAESGGSGTAIRCYPNRHYFWFSKSGTELYGSQQNFPILLHGSILSRRHVETRTLPSAQCGSFQDRCFHFVEDGGNQNAVGSIDFGFGTVSSQPSSKHPSRSAYSDSQRASRRIGEQASTLDVRMSLRSTMRTAYRTQFAAKDREFS